MRMCAVCKTKYQKGVGSLFRVPTDEESRNKWSQVCGVNLLQSARICSDHFLSTSIIHVGKRISLLPDAEPFMVQLYQPMEEQGPDIVSDNIGVDSVTGVGNLCQSMEQQDTDLGMEQQGTNFVSDHIGLTSITAVDNLCQSMEWLSGATTTNTGLYTYNCGTNINQKVGYKEGETETEIHWKEGGTQTDESIFGIEYFARIRALEAENKELKCQLAQANAAADAMRKIFTDGQVRKLMSPGRINWRWKDISSAVCLHAAGPRAYNHLYRKGFPLPHRSTLQRWCGRINMTEGILYSSIEFMRTTSDLAHEEKICVLVFDEMKVAETYEYDPLADVVKKPAAYVQVIMARGLRKSWKQPVFYGFDWLVTKSLLTNIIISLHNAGFTVVATVCDMGPKNLTLWKELGVTTDNPWFPSPVSENDKIFVFADAPHLLKLVRNHFLDTGLMFGDTLVTTRTIADLLALTSKSDMSITFKLTNEHLTVKGAGRQKVKLAAQLFSSTTANAIRRCYSLGMDLYNPNETADFIQLINDWFDVLNSTLNNFKYPGKQPYGLALESQDKILLRMNELMKVSIIPGRKSLAPFQKGILMTNSALMMLQKYVERFNMTYLVTNRLNQDVLEHFFGAIRSKGGLNDHPSPRDFKFRLRKYILARNTEHLDGKGNVENDSTDWINSSLEASVLHGTEGEGAQDISGVEELSPDTIDDELDELVESNFEDIGVLQEDALEYVSGYIIKKLNLEEYECHTDSFSWVDQVSKCSLKKPNESFLADVKKLETIFGQVNGKNITHCRRLQQHLLHRSQRIMLPEKIKRFFFKCRIHFRVRDLNKRLKVQKAKQRLMGFKKMFKINI